MSSQTSHMEIQWIEESFSNRPSPGVEGRYFRVDDPNDSEFGHVYRDTGSAWELIDLGVGTLSTDELYNDEEPNLDISETYSWVLSAGRPLPTWHFNTTTGVQQNTSGSGAISANTARGDISSGSTDGSHARALRTIANDNNYSFNNGQRAFMQVRVDDTQGKLFAGTGIVNEDDFTPEHIGFKWTGGNLEGSVADGSTESTTTLDASPTTGSFVDLYIDYDGTEAKFWIEKTPAGNDPDGTITTNLPSGDAGNIYCFHVENDSATNRQMFATIAAGGQMP